MGIVGLASQSTPTTTLPSHAQGFTFNDYEKALRETVAELRAQGAQMIFVTSHLCDSEIANLAVTVQDLKIDFFGGGHCHSYGPIANSAGLVAIAGGAYFSGYGYARYTLDAATNAVLGVSYGVRTNDYPKADPGIAELISSWNEKVQADVGTVIGYTDHDLTFDERARLSAGSALWAFPADLAMYAASGIKGLPKGDITLGSVISMLPYRNDVIQVSLTGAQVNQVVNQRPGLVIAGGTWTNGAVVLDATGAPVVPAKVYSVLFDQFVYEGGDGYPPILEPSGGE
ncbi:MAG: 5'-nucleotidase C-terminal domain-containing protein [Myxococcales bacterium]